MLCLSYPNLFLLVDLSRQEVSGLEVFESTAACMCTSSGVVCGRGLVD